MTNMVVLGELMADKKKTLDPRRHPDESFELFSIPAFDAGKAERLIGSEVGSTKQVVEPGDVLLSRIVPHIRRAWVVPGSSGCTQIGSSEWIVFRSHRADPRYLRHLLVSNRFHQSFMQTVAGVGGSLLRARPSYVAKIEVPLPSIEEQRRIAGVLDAADALRVKRREAIAKLDTLTQSIFIDMFGDLFKPATTTSSETLSLGGMVDRGFLEIGRGRVISKKDIALTPGEYPIYSSAALNNGEFGRYGLYDFDEEMITWSVDGGGHFFHRPKHRFSVTNVGGWIRVLNREALDPYYLWQALSLLHSRLVFDWSQKAHSSVIKRVYERVPLPSLSEQATFRTQVERLSGLRETVVKSASALDTLFASLQQRAFAGEL